jgi:hypothetical protein
MPNVYNDVMIAKTRLSNKIGGGILMVRKILPALH